MLWLNIILETKCLYLNTVRILNQIKYRTNEKTWYIINISHTCFNIIYITIHEFYI
jgi:hypothetical protein